MERGCSIKNNDTSLKSKTSFCMSRLLGARLVLSQLQPFFQTFKKTWDARNALHRHDDSRIAWNWQMPTFISLFGHLGEVLGAALGPWDGDGPWFRWTIGFNCLWWVLVPWVVVTIYGAVWPWFWMHLALAFLASGLHPKRRVGKGERANRG